VEDGASRGGAGEALRALFVSDDDLRTGARAQEPRASEAAKEAGEEGAPVPQAPAALAPRVSLESLRGRDAVVRVDGTDHDVAFTIPGIHNQLNACAALAVALEALGDRADLEGLLATLARVQAAFGRGEVLSLDGRDVQLSLVKNPAGFRMGLLTAEQAVRSGGPESVMIAINDEYADGRDMSWLWDVEFAGLRSEGVAVVTGVRAWDMALRLRYDEVGIGAVEPDLAKAVALLRKAAKKADDGAGRPMRIFTTYTAMLALRAHLAELTDVEEALT